MENITWIETRNDRFFHRGTDCGSRFVYFGTVGRDLFISESFRPILSCPIGKFGKKTGSLQWQLLSSLSLDLKKNLTRRGIQNFSSPTLLPYTTHLNSCCFSLLLPHEY